MNINRLISRRDKDGSAHRRVKSRDKGTEKKSPIIHGEGGLISIFKPSYPQQKLDKDKAKEFKEKVSAIKKRLKEEGCTSLSDENIDFVLGCQNTKGSVEKSMELLRIFQESLHFQIVPFNPDVYLRGAVNREFVTCYIDSLLFAIFAKLPNYEDILLQRFQDEPRNRLSAILRVYVNMLRRGVLIEADITEQLQVAMADCGWENARTTQQQDVAEAFCHLADILGMPLLRMEMHLYHGAKEGDPDDHKFVEERLLNIAIPDHLPPGRTCWKLEEIMEAYFTSPIHVTRPLERSVTKSSLQIANSHYDEQGEASTLPQINFPDHPFSWSTPDNPVTPATPRTSNSRDRSTSIIWARVQPPDKKPEDSPQSSTIDFLNMKTDTMLGPESIDSGKSFSTPLVRNDSVRKEASVEAWQSFTIKHENPSSESTLPNSEPIDNNPLIGVCLKRYGFDEKGPKRNGIPVDIPLEIRIPHFTSSEGGVEEDVKLSLQSFVCHQGDRIDSGHYISYTRGTAPIVDGDYKSDRKLVNANRPPGYSEERWIRFNDLAKPRIENVDVREALGTEMPYLLFYQLQSYKTVTPPDPEPPSYHESNFEANLINCTPQEDRPSYFDSAAYDPTLSGRVSEEVPLSDTPRHSLNLPEGSIESRRGSLPSTEYSLASTANSILTTSQPSTPVEETTAQKVSRAAHKFTRANKTRSTSQSEDKSVENRVEKRISNTFSRLAMMKSKDQVVTKPDNQNPEESTGPSDTIINPADVEPRRSIAIETPTEQTEHLSEFNADVGRSRSRKGKDKKREKSKGPSERSEGHYYGHYKEKVQDRECTIM
ncbi:uncharacterized protein L3040_008559 [Drepanopeziza brunnea f. sp. 'multigermtubi']|uniref:ubiquitinyl hydrolase 1 n=1 Tax=Marssonina brunnea f. sp. multigermtubi (strain MB_m1) TaxID=1072389 RepID=K1X159_MARBU|nr:putative ubiquitin carboxy terminal hydrolase [Drepanopeziza brunnea f. sp. 'multigermtubi' MB_m1]EKD18971.1 putative ubiquitin carboxy terminal hydrolase [Drepanopeziza brunnea f. sp. 'multigermtubi' MB_m1]KAJ5033444.1 hypothetical protein L3040_008559 [Drepanopeziza brunnea f. sp. 'multigermtubi']